MSISYANWNDGKKQSCCAWLERRLLVDVTRRKGFIEFEFVMKKKNKKIKPLTSRRQRGILRYRWRWSGRLSVISRFWQLTRLEILLPLKPSQFLTILFLQEFRRVVYTPYFTRGGVVLYWARHNNSI